MLGVNLGTGTPQSAVNLLEYVNSDLPTCYADLRKKNGREKPYGVKLWCLGNEMDGPWQICGKTAEEYGRIACETAKMMKWLDPSIELVACGSSFHAMPTFGIWERTVLNHCYEHIDYLSLHQYYKNSDDDIPSFLACSLEMDEFIKTVAGFCGSIKQEKGGGHEVFLSFDEWNIWYHFQKDCAMPPKWTVARPIEEEVYNTADALLLGCMMNTLINNADTVKIACLAQLVNTIAPIMTEAGGRSWVQTIYHPFRYASVYGRGTALRMSISGATYNCRVRQGVPYIDGSAVLSEDGRELTLFLINRAAEQDMPCELSITGTNPSVIEWVSLCGCNPAAVNTVHDAPFQPGPMRGAAVRSTTVSFTLPKFSWNMLRLSLG